MIAFMLLIFGSSISLASESVLGLGSQVVSEPNAIESAREDNSFNRCVDHANNVAWSYVAFSCDGVSISTTSCILSEVLNGLPDPIDEC